MQVHTYHLCIKNYYNVSIQVRIHRLACTKLRKKLSNAHTILNADTNTVFCTVESKFKVKKKVIKKSYE